MADFYITWPSSHVRGSPGINVGHGAYHPGLAEYRLVASREVSLRLCLFTQSVEERQGNQHHGPEASAQHRSWEWTIRELAVWDWVGAAGGPGK